MVNQNHANSVTGVQFKRQK